MAVSGIPPLTGPKLGRGNWKNSLNTSFMQRVELVQTGLECSTSVMNSNNLCREMRRSSKSLDRPSDREPILRKSFVEQLEDFVKLFSLNSYSELALPDVRSL